MCCKQITTVSLDQNIKSNSAHSINLKHSLQIKTGFAAALQTCPSPPPRLKGLHIFQVKNSWAREFRMRRNCCIAQNLVKNSKPCKIPQKILNEKLLKLMMIQTIF